jgi:hypothetical protein
MTLPELLSSWMQALKAKFTVKLQVAVLLAASFAVHVTVVTPSGNVEPDGGLHTVVTPGQLSLAVGVANVTNLLVLAGHAGAATVVTFAGQVITGGWVSVTVTVKVQSGLAGVPGALHTTVVVPTGKNDPLGGEQVTAPQIIPPPAIGSE